MATITTTIGSRSAENVAISSVSGDGPWTVTLSSSPSTTLVGDKLTDEAASPNSYLITGVAGADITVIDAFGAGVAPDDSNTSQATTVRSYASLSAWNTGLDSADMYANGDYAIGYLCESVTLSAGLFLNGGATVGLSGVMLSGHATTRHTGEFGSGVKIATTYATTYPIGIFTTAPWIIEWLEFSRECASGSAVNGGLIETYSASTRTIRHCLLRTNKYAATSSLQLCGVRVGGTGQTLIMHNCIVADVINPTTGAGVGIQLGNTSDTHRLYNCTVYGCGSHGFQSNYLGAAKNCISMGNGGDDFSGSWHATNCSNNYSEDGTAPGSTGSLSGQTVADTFLDADNLNFHLRSTANAVNAGANLAGVLSGIEIDIDSETRDGAWDIGADQYSAAAGSPSSSLSASGSASSSAPPTTIAPVIQNLFLRD